MHAYLILAHQDGGALNRLVRRLSKTGNVYLHIDKKSDLKVDSELSSLKNVYVTSQVKVRWGHWSMIEAVLLLANLAIKEGNTRLTLLSGVHYPMVSDTQLSSLAANGYDYFEAKPVEEGVVREHILERYRRKYLFAPALRIMDIRILTRIWHAVVRRLILKSKAMDFEKTLSPLKAQFGSQFWSVRSSTFIAAIDYARSKPEIDRYFKSIFCPDEGYFQTLFARFSDAHVNQGTTYVKWASRGTPRPLEIADLDQEIVAGKYLFTRKVFSGDIQLVRRLDELNV